MQMVDFNRYGQNQRMYGGTAGRKMGIVYEGKNYILKFPVHDTGVSLSGRMEQRKRVQIIVY